MTEVLDLSSRVLPQSVRYSNLTPLAVVGKSCRKKFYPSYSGPFNIQNNTIRIELNSATGFLDGTMSYFKFTLDYTAPAGGADIYLNLDGSASSMIKRLKISSKSGEAILEDIYNYNNLYNTLSDYTLDQGHRATLLRMTEGYGDEVGIGVDAGTDEAYITYTAADVNAKTCEKKMQFCVPLLSSVIGISSKKYLPLFLCGPIIVEIEITPEGLWSDGLDRNKFQIIEPELHCEIVEFDQSINDALKSVAMSSGIYLHGTSWRNYNRPLLASADENIMINERLKSIKSFLMTFRLQPTGVNIFKQRYMGRISRQMTSLQLKIGDMLVPQTELIGDADNVAEFICETQKALGIYGSTLSGYSVVNQASWGVNIMSTDVTRVGRALYGIDLDNFKGQDVESGVNMVLNSPLNVMIKGSETDCLCDVYLLFDCLYALRPDVTFTVSY